MKHSVCSVARRGRCWFRIRWSLRALLIALGLVCVATATVNHYLVIKQKRFRLIKEIEELGGFVSELSTSRILSDEGEPRIAWFDRFLPDRYQQVVASISFLGAEDVSSFDFGKLSLLPELEELEVNLDTITSSQLFKITRHENLRSLNLNTTSATDEAICHLTGVCPNLTELRVGGTRITDIGLKCITSCSKLQLLDISDTDVTPDGIMNLRDLANLQTLIVDGIEITQRDWTSLERALPLRQRRLQENFPEENVPEREKVAPHNEDVLNAETNDVACKPIVGVAAKP